MNRKCLLNHNNRLTGLARLSCHIHKIQEEMADDDTTLSIYHDPTTNNQQTLQGSREVFTSGFGKRLLVLTEHAETISDICNNASSMHTSVFKPPTISQGRRHLHG